MILYFSATGNSEYVAKYIAYLNDDKVVCMNEYLQNNSAMELNSEKPYVVIAPIYISSMPVIILDLLKKSKLEGNKNIYYIMTCAGSGVSAAGAFVEPLSNEMNLIYRGIEHLSMPQDYLMFFTVDTQENNELKMNKALERVPELARLIREDQDFDKTKVGASHKASVKPTIWLFDKFFIKPKKFYATDACVGCGLCSKVCPLNNITILKGQKPIWGNTCVHCTACINKCPKGAIEYGKKTIGKNRYVAKKFNPNDIK